MDEELTRKLRELVLTIRTAADEVLGLLSSADGAGEQTEQQSRFDDLDRSRRQRPEWKRRGRVFYAIDQAGGRVSDLEFVQILLRAGYADMRGANGFFRGDPMPVLEREGGYVVLTERGIHAARFYERYWLPQENGKG
jgi:hypothetical protein